MGHFSGHLDSIRHIGYTKAWPWGRAKLYLAENSTEKQIMYHTNDGYIVKLPKTVITDLASIPYPINKVMPEAGGATCSEQWYRAAIFHDDWYQRNGMICCYGDEQSFFTTQKTRKWCDDRFYDMLIDSCVDNKTARLMHFAVRTFGQGPWDKHKKGGR